MVSSNKEVKSKLLELYDEIFSHDGYGEMQVEIKILKKGQKEIIIHCGKQYRFVVDYKKETPVVRGRMENSELMTENRKPIADSSLSG
jgi:hypothetical protein